MNERSQRWGNLKDDVYKHKYSGALLIMFKNAFANLQKVGKSLMLPVSVLPD